MEADQSGSEHAGGAWRMAMPAAAVALGVMALAALAVASRWPLVQDAPLMHYVVFLMDHGRAPYRDIVDMNMPGTYLTEGLAMHVLGGGAFGWWLWDGLICACVVASCAWIAGPAARAAGIAAGALTCLAHLMNGPADLGQRDWLVAALLLAAMGFLVQALRRGRPGWMFGFMALCGLAASVKPPAIGVGVAFLAVAAWMAMRPSAARPAMRGGPLAVLLWAALGLVPPAAMTAGFLLRWGVTGDFLAMMRGLVPWYASLKPAGPVLLAHRALIPPLAMAGAAAVFLLARGWRDWTLNLLLLASLAGAGLFFIQGKGWPYHRYPEIAFVVLWGMLALRQGLSLAPSRARWVAAGWLAVCVLALGPLMLRQAVALDFSLRTILSLQADLARLGGPALSGKVQCLDMTGAGCINALYRTGLVQSTGSLYDFYLFPQPANAVARAQQARFLDAVTRDPPRVIVLSAHNWPSDTYGYGQVGRWPAFQSFLLGRYRLDREVATVAPDSAGYRLYVLRSPGAGRAIASRQ